MADLDRKSLLKRAEDRFDLLVIGGGATGAGVALDAASRGLKTLLVEKYDFSAQTSSRSTKLIHGGVRYLEAAIKRLDRVQWNLVKDALKERSVLLRIAPHLARKIELLTPLYRAIEVPYFLTGLKLYEALAGKERLGKAYFLPKQEALRRFPQLKAEGLKGGVVYADGQFDDARMNVALVLTALQKGAVAINHAEVTGFIKEGGKVVGAEIRDRLSGDLFATRARMIVNATGPFTDRIRRLDDPEAPPMLATSSGVHLVLPGKYAPPETGLLIPRTEDGRVLFVLPWHGHTLVGTTDEPAAPTEHPRPTEAEVTYILRHLKKHFAIDVTEDEVRSAWSGLRPLVKDPRAQDTAKLARDHVIVESSSGLVTIAGGKWTTYRKMALDVVDHLNRTRNLGLPPSQTQALPLKGGKIESLDLAQLERAAPSPEVAEHLYHTYGDQALQVLALAREEGLLAPLVEGFPHLEAEVVWSARHELAEHPLDILERRTRIAFLNQKAALKALPRVTELMGQEKGWSEAEKARMLHESEAWLTIAP